MGARAAFGLQWLIPAHAGKTYTSVDFQTEYKAHPRSRGENEGGDGFGDPLAGSSPLTRGKPHEDVEAIPERRLIPAHAGKRAESVAPHGTKQAHPRSRGENFVGWPALACLWGSSPLTRGKPRDTRTTSRKGGLIPAHAGKTADIAGRLG